LWISTACMKTNALTFAGDSVMSTFSPKRDKVDQLHEGQERAALRRHRGESTGQHKSWEASPKPLAVRREEAAEESRYVIVKITECHWIVVPVGEPIGEWVPSEVQAARDEWAAIQDTF
jgi:hypothetical protein